MFTWHRTVFQLSSDFTYYYHFGVDDYLRELLTLDDTGSFLGSYKVTIHRNGPCGGTHYDVENVTGWESGTRSPVRGAQKNSSIEDMVTGQAPWNFNPRSILNDRPQSAPGPGGNMEQHYWWNE